MERIMDKKEGKMEKITSCDPAIFGRVFGGTFTGVLSGLCHAVDFKTAWREAEQCCKGVDDIVVPAENGQIGEYVSRSGKKYIFGSEQPKNRAKLFYIIAPETSSLDISALLSEEIRITGHVQCCVVTSL